MKSYLNLKSWGLAFAAIILVSTTPLQGWKRMLAAFILLILFEAVFGKKATAPIPQKSEAGEAP